MREQITSKVINEFHRILDEPVSEPAIEFAVQDVYETSAIEDEGYYSDGDIILAVRRTLLYAVNKTF